MNLMKEDDYTRKCPVDLELNNLDNQVLTTRYSQYYWIM